MNGTDHTRLDLYVESEVARHLEDSEVSKLSHFNAAEVYDRRQKHWIAIPATCSALLLTWLLTTPFENVVSVPLARFLKEGLPTVFGLLTSALSAVGFTLNFGELANKHRTAAHKYQEIWRECKNWKTDFPTSVTAERASHAAKLLRSRLSEINREAPQIPGWAWQSVNKQRALGSTRYQAESVGSQKGDSRIEKTS